MSFIPPGEPGFRFSDGKLRIFRENEVMVIQGWPDPTAVVKTMRCPSWCPFQPAIRLVKPYRCTKKKTAEAKRRTRVSEDDGSAAAGDAPQQLAFDFAAALPAPSRERPALTQAQRRKRAFDGFRFSLPKEVAKALEPFRSYQWPLLLLLKFDPDSRDLTRSNPVLAYLVAQCLRGDVQQIRSLEPGRLKQREILRMLQLPGSNALVKLLRKIQPQSVTGENWRRLLAVLRSTDGKIRQRISHLERINTGVLEILLDPALAEACGSRLLEGVAADRRESYL